MIKRLAGKKFSNNTDYWMLNETFNELANQATVRLTDVGLVELSFEDECNTKIALKFGERIFGPCTKTGVTKTISVTQVAYIIENDKKVYEADAVTKTYYKDFEIL